MPGEDDDAYDEGEDGPRRRAVAGAPARGAGPDAVHPGAARVAGRHLGGVGADVRIGTAQSRLPGAPPAPRRARGPARAGGRDPRGGRVRPRRVALPAGPLPGLLLRGRRGGRPPRTAPVARVRGGRPARDRRREPGGRGALGGLARRRAREPEPGESERPRARGGTPLPRAAGEPGGAARHDHLGPQGLTAREPLDRRARSRLHGDPRALCRGRSRRRDPAPRALGAGPRPRGVGPLALSGGLARPRARRAHLPRARDDRE